MVQRVGDTSDLAALAQSLTGGELNVSHDGQDYVLMSERFASSDKAIGVHQKAEDRIAIRMGHLVLCWTPRNRLGSGRCIDAARMASATPMFFPSLP
jgi:hypothetical protein